MLEWHATPPLLRHTAMTDSTASDPATPQTLLAFDFGTRKIGVAVGQALTHSATPLTALHARGGQPDWQGIEKVVQEWRPDALVVGLPANMDGSPHHMTHAARNFARQLEKRFSLPVHLVDERLSSNEARRRHAQQRADGSRRRGRRGDLDTLAAAIILETWFESLLH
jgi:putative Holliday junction resolvase